ADSDQLSDRDLLLVSGNFRAVEEASASMTSEGYSCAGYTWKKLRYLAARGSLFIQHLKQEGILLRDRGNQLGLLLKGFVPSLNNEAQLKSARRLALLTRCFADTDYCIGWAL